MELEAKRKDLKLFHEKINNVLDYNDIQKEVFIKQIKLANKLNLPLVIHDREAHKDTFDILKEENKGSKVLFHCFSGSVEFMKECVKEGWYIAIRHDGGDYRDEHEVYRLDEYIDYYQQKIQEIIDLTKS